MKLKNLLDGVSVQELSGNTEIDIKGISHSSKAIQEGYVFAALKGLKTDGLLFIQEALDKKAAGVISESEKPSGFSGTWIQVQDSREALALCAANFYSHPSQSLKIVGITGTKGKTTITYILEEILRQAHFRPGVLGTVSYRGPGVELSAERTTPEASDLQRMLKEMLDHAATHCLIEISSHSLELKRVAGISFDAAVFTNLSGEHLDYHISMDRYFEAKKKLFSLGKKNFTAVINADNVWGKKLISQIPGKKMTFGLDADAEVYAKKFRFDKWGIDLVAGFPGGQIEITSPLLGKPNLYNILASISTALSMEIPVPAIRSGISSLRGVPGRFQTIANTLGYTVIVDYAHTDDALKNLLETARELTRERVVLVFGAGGDRDKTKRPRMGKVAAQLADKIIVTSDNPRSEDPMAIIADIERGIETEGRQDYMVQPDRKKAISQALAEAREGDCILIAGKGHETYQIIKDKVLHFNDAEIAREILRELERH